MSANSQKRSAPWAVLDLEKKLVSGNRKCEVCIRKTRLCHNGQKHDMRHDKKVCIGADASINLIKLQAT